MAVLRLSFVKHSVHTSGKAFAHGVSAPPMGDAAFSPSVTHCLVRTSLLSLSDMFTEMCSAGKDEEI